MRSSTRFVRGLAAAAAAAAWIGAGPALARDAEAGSKGWLGVLVSGAGDQVKIVQVMPDSAAAKAGLARGDVVLKVDGKPVTDTEAFVGAIHELQAGDPVRLTLKREGKEMDQTVTLAERPAEGADCTHCGGSGWMPGLHHLMMGRGGPKVRLGVNVEPLTAGLRTYFGVEDELGVLVSDVAQNSPAEKAGLKAGDVIVGVNGKPVHSAPSLLESLSELKAGDRAELRVVRDRAVTTVPVTVEAREDGEQGCCAWPRTFEWKTPDDEGASLEQLQRLDELSSLPQDIDQHVQESLEKALKDLEAKDHTRLQLKQESLEQALKNLQEAKDHTRLKLKHVTVGTHGGYDI